MARNTAPTDTTTTRQHMSVPTRVAEVAMVGQASAELPGRGNRGVPDGTYTLTTRQRQVFHLLNIGLSYDQVATALCLSEKTVRRYASDAIARLGCDNIRHALHVARRSGLVSDE